MKILFEYCEGCGKHPNEDAYGYDNNTLWVIDGATDIFNYKYFSGVSDVQWIVQELNYVLKEKSSLISLKEMLRAAIGSVRLKALNIAPIINTIPINQLPTFSICCVRINKNSLEYLCIGDCSLFCSRSPSIRYSDLRILPFHYQVNEVKEKYKDNQNEYNKQVLKKVREIKKYINTKEGYWVGTLDPNVVDNSVEGYIDINQGDRVLLCSDGFRPSLDEANLIPFSPNDIFDEKSVNRLIENQIFSEEKHQLQTGINISDDKTILLVEI
ncbi:MAG: hypothetical protein NC313_12745 [Butyrivibrio sp.]|nr:hypothetical protein [Butyrivibrio sp.]